MHFLVLDLHALRFFFLFFIAEPIKMCTAVNDRSHETTHSDTQQGTTFTMTVTFSVMFTKVLKMVTKVVVLMQPGTKKITTFASCKSTLLSYKTQKS